MLKVTPADHFELEQLGKDLFRLPLRHGQFFRDRCAVHLLASEPLKIPAEPQAVPVSLTVMAQRR